MPEVGDSLGRYTLLRRLAVGGMGEVFVAAKPGPVGFGPYVALKVLRDELACDPQFVDMIVDEANISMFLNHQNVVSVLDLGQDEGTYYIAMEYVQGITVERMMESLSARGKKLAVPVALYVGLELCRALKYAHTRINHQGEPLDIIHRDVTPANILLSVQGEVKLTDFGIARAQGRIHQTQAGVLKGKFGYMAPEMVRYEQLDARADLFCTGVCLYLMLCGRHPVAGAAVMEAIQNYEEKRIPPPSALNPAISPELDAVVMRCLEPKVEHRWRSAAALGEALQDVLLRSPEWRTAAQDGARQIARQIGQVAPEAFDAPVSPEQSRHLLERARAARARAASTPAAEPPLGHERLPALKQRLPSEASTPAGPQDGLDLPTASALPAITPDMDFGATPAVDMDRETDESLDRAAMDAARSALDRETYDTDENQPGVSRAEVPNGPEDYGFPESSTDRNRLQDSLLDEPSLPAPGEDGFAQAPGEEVAEATVAQAVQFPVEPPPVAADGTYEEEIIERDLVADTGDDGATVVAHAIDEDRLDGVDPSPAAESNEATVAGVSMEDLAHAGPSTAASSVPQASLLERPDSEPATVLPEADGLDDTSQWDPAAAGAEDLGDATLLDGLDANQIQAALQAQERAAARPEVVEPPAPLASRGGPSAGLGDDDGGATLDGGSAFDPAALGLVPDGAAPSRPASSASAGEWPSEPDPGALDGATAARPPNGHHQAVSGQPADDSAPTAVPPGPRAPGRPAGPSVATLDDGGVGQNTGRWMAGQLDAGALAWDDDAAARRAVATRNQAFNGGAAAGSDPGYAPVPAVGSNPGYPATEPYPPVPGWATSAPPPPAYAPPGFWVRNGLLVGSLALIFALAAGVGYAWFETQVFWPKLTLESTPAGARVTVDGREILQRTPVTVQVAPETRHLIRFQQDGFRTTTREITEGVTRFRNYTLRVTLSEATRTLHLPVEGTVFVNGEVVATGQRVELDALPASGRIVLRVEAKGYAPYEVSFQSAAEVPPSLDVPLREE